jgi:hypothetical protein
VFPWVGVSNVPTMYIYYQKPSTEKYFSFSDAYVVTGKPKKC